MNIQRRTIHLYIITVVLSLLAATALAVSFKPLYGVATLLGIALIVGFVRAFGQKDVWFKAKRRAVDVLFLILIVLLLVLTIPFLEQPSPV